MFWQDEAPESREPVSLDDVVDVSYTLVGRTIPVEHAYALLEALSRALPWLPGQADAGVHSIHVAASQNGWYRPDEATGGVLHISRRTRMTLRLPGARLKDAEALTGTTLDMEGHAITVGPLSVRPLLPLPTLFARSVAGPREQSEDAFLQDAAAELRRLGIRPRKLLCGRVGEVRTPAGGIFTRSLLVADLTPDESLALQRHGVGPDRKLGCGLFVPHKGVGPVRKADNG